MLALLVWRVLGGYICSVLCRLAAWGWIAVPNSCARPREVTAEDWAALRTYDKKASAVREMLVQNQLL